jgi:hypothetical protein
MPFPDGAFDYLVCVRFMCHLPAVVRRQVMSEMVRVTSQTLIVHYLSASLLPLSLLERRVARDLEGSPARIVESRRLSWYVRSSALVAIERARPCGRAGRGGRGPRTGA